MPDLDERYRALARTQGPDLWDEIATREPRPLVGTRTSGARRLMGAVLALIVAGVGLAFGFRALQKSPDGDQTTASKASPGEPEPTPEPEPSPERFRPDTYREGGSVVMPVTFPDGRTAEIVYPPELDLAGLQVVPRGFAEPIVAPGCEAILYAFRGKERFLHPDATLAATYPGATGEPVEVWEQPEKEYPPAWIVFRFGSWGVGVPSQFHCRDAEVVAAFASGVTGHETPDGFLVLETKLPVRSFRPGDPDAPGLSFEGDGLQVQISSTPCTLRGDVQTIAGKRVRRTELLAEWCLPEDDILVRVEGDGSLIDSFIRGIEIRRVSTGTPVT